METTTVCVLGLGYIGLPTASVLAAYGYQVLGVDIAPGVAATVACGRIHIEEPGLQTLVRAAVQSGNLRTATQPEPADVFIIAVPTPLTDDHRAEMRHVREAAESIAPHLRPGNLVILESTSPPGTCANLLAPILTRNGLELEKDLFLAHCPERVLPGKILRELIENDRVIGGIGAQSAERARQLYASFVEGRILCTSAATAEMVKLLENTYRDVNIALANEAALLCETLGIDYWETVALANRHPRVQLHQAGPGVGGHCISVDPWFLVEQQPEQARIIRTARERNDAMPAHVTKIVREWLADLDQPNAALLGLAYKADVDDTRESPAIAVAAQLEAAGVNVTCYDPHVKQGLFRSETLEACLREADCVVLLTGHAEFNAIDPAQAAQWMRRARLYDTRNALDHNAWRAAGFEVRVLGKGNAR